MEKVFAAMGLNTPDKIKAFDNYLRRNFNVPHFYQDNFNKNRNDPDIIHALKSEDKRKRKILFYVPADIVAELRSFGIDLAVGGAGKATFTGYKQTFTANVKKHLKTEADFVAAKETPISQWTTVEKLDSVIRRAVILLPEDVGNQLLGLISPWSLAAMVSILGLWAVGHFFAVSMIIDALVILGGALAGLAAGQAVEDLYSFAVKCIYGKTKEDLDESAHHLSEAIAVIGIQTLMTLLLLRAPKVFHEPSVELNKPVKPLTFDSPGIQKPPTSSESFFENYEPGLTYLKHNFAEPTAPGSTAPWGEITIHYGRNTPFNEMELTFFHEQIHRILTPKLQGFRWLRQTFIILKKNSYLQSFILRYLEEALAETVSQVRGNGWRKFFLGVKFPLGVPGVKAYVSKEKIGMEALGILMGPITVGGMTFYARVVFDED